MSATHSTAARQCRGYVMGLAEVKSSATSKRFRSKKELVERRPPHSSPCPLASTSLPSSKTLKSADSRRSRMLAMKESHTQPSITR